MRLIAQLGLMFFGLLPHVIARPSEVSPVRDGPESLSLNGSWQFKYSAGSDAGGDLAWSAAAVPGHWELQGFGRPRYGLDLEAGTGIYRRDFRVPADWRDKRVFLHFDGILYGFDVWVNGIKTGSWASGYNPVAFEVTDAIKPQGENLLVAKVSTRSLGWEFDVNDCWALSGIYRDVTLFAVPTAHFQHFTTQTRLAPDGSATLNVSTRLSAAATVSGRLLDPDGQAAGELVFPKKVFTDISAGLKVENPRLWTAETPALYTLELELSSGQKIVTKIGLREVGIVDGVLQLNGAPIKLRGINHHDIWPGQGRVATEELMRRDLELMRAANINFIRTSHYPPHPRLLELCDELGFYVMDEVPFGFGDKHLDDPAYAESLLTRAQATVRRDQNHASVIIWSVGNENHNTPLTIATARRVKELDPTRPVCFPQTGGFFAGHYSELPEDIDIHAPHYPNTPLVGKYAGQLARPIIFTEYAHALGLATDQIQAQWAVMQASPRIAGGAIWMFQDQGIRRAAEAGQTPETSHELGLAVWPDAKHYYDTSGNRGMDGIVYSDRKPQADYWQVRKVYSPVQITARTAPVGPGENRVNLEVENRFDFRSLQGVTLRWSLLRNGVAGEGGVIPLKAVARSTEDVPLVFELPADVGPGVYALEVSCADGAADGFYERSFLLATLPDGVSRSSLLAAVRSAAPLTLDESAAEIRISHPGFDLTISRASGGIALRDPKGRVLAAGFFPHAGRRFTEGELMRLKKEKTWPGGLLLPSSAPETSAKQTAEGVVLRVRGRYPRPGDPQQALDGGLQALVRTNGTIDVQYDYKPVNGRGMLLEAGLAMTVPGRASEFRWIGAGPYAGYPGKDALNEFGIFHLNRADLNFQGNRRQVELALLTAPDGAGVALGGVDMDVAVEHDGENTILSHNAVLSGRGTKFVKPDTAITADAEPVIAGRFILQPLGSAWPTPLAEWFGPASATVPVLQPYFHSYDQ